MTREEVYRRDLEALGIYNPAFDPAIHSLAMLERELQRTMKAWKLTAEDPKQPPSPLDPLYAVIVQQRRDIMAYRDALGLTPKALRRLIRAIADGTPAAGATIAQKLDAIFDQVSAYE